MYFLFDCTDGYFLYDENKIQMAKYEYVDVDESIDSIMQMHNNKVPSALIKFLEENKIEEFAVADESMKQLLSQYKAVVDLDFYRKLNNVPRKMLTNIAHKFAQQNIQFDERHNDIGIIQGIRTYDDFERDMNIHIMRIREWYGFHFPELNFIYENINFLRTVKIIQRKSKFCEYDKLEDILKKEEIDRIKNMLPLSMGADITDEDMEKILEDIESILKINDYREELKKYLKNRTEEVAPNMHMMLGELFTARYIARAGGIRKLAKMPASTIQILGAEKALFNALKNKINTPKYGLIFSHPLLGMSKHKGKFTRAFCAKIALCARVDAYSKDRTGTFGKNSIEELHKKYIK